MIFAWYLKVSQSCFLMVSITYPSFMQNLNPHPTSKFSSKSSMEKTNTFPKKGINLSGAVAKCNDLPGAQNDADCVTKFGAGQYPFIYQIKEDSRGVCCDLNGRTVEMPGACAAI